VRNSWAVLETSSDSGGLARYPIKTALLLAFALLFLQGLSELAKVAVRLYGLEDPVSPGARGEIGFRGEGV
jgi:TRAP-type mannitol/chloroaromatic compound transport system permease small subunit